MAWLTTEVEPSVVHVTPLDDLIVHDFDDHCVCGPRCDLILGDHPDGHVYVHRALDGRTDE